MFDAPATLPPLPSLAASAKLPLSLLARVLRPVTGTGHPETRMFMPAHIFVSAVAIPLDAPA